MADNSLYQVVFDGTLTGKIGLDKVKKNLAAVFKMNAAQVEALFTGNPVVIKRNVDEATAKKYVQAFQKAGAKCILIADRAASSPSTSAAPAAGGISRETGRMSGKDIVKKSVPKDLGGLSLGQPGETIPTLNEQQEIELPDLSALSLAKDDGYLVKPSNVPEPKVNIKGLKVEDID